MGENYFHKPVLLNEVLQYLEPQDENAIFVDATTGEAGHSEAVLKNFSSSLRLISLDADSEIQKRAKKRLEKFSSRVQFFNTWFDDFFENYPSDLERPDLILFDLGISVFHYAASNRGFSFQKGEKLDMRLSKNLEKTASDFVNNEKEEDLANLIFNFGEERYSRRIAKAIVERRKSKKFEFASDLADTIFHAVPESYRHLHSSCATKTFQALRIAVNDELGRLNRVLESSFRVLKVGGKMAVITFHSLEDKIVKSFFREKAKKCICPPEVPICKCRGRSEVEILTKKAILPTSEEIAENPPSRSAKLRVVKKIFENENEVKYGLRF